MKTAMQLAFERIELMERVDKDSTHWQMFKEHYLEKEKEQIMNAWDKRGSTIVPKYYLEENINGEQYYKETYQNK